MTPGETFCLKKEGAQGCLWGQAVTSRGKNTRNIKQLVDSPTCCLHCLHQLLSSYFWYRHLQQQHHKQQ
eukprot:scaffold292768_cov14-Tisochrysis_lutea.AAC.1